MAAPSEETLALLRESFPAEEGFVSVQLPRLSMVSQDKTEGKGKNMKVVAEAGQFLKETQDEEETATEVEELVKGKTVTKTVMKKLWSKEDLGTEIEGVIIFQRKQLKFYDESTEMFTSSPIYDSDEDVIPLFCNKSQIDEGTPKELKAKYEYTDKNGKVKSKLEDNRIIYILYEGAVYQMNLRGSSMYSYMTYHRKVGSPAVYLTKFSSEPMEKGSIAWNQMQFEAIRPITADESEQAAQFVTEIKQGIQQQKRFFASKTVDPERIAVLRSANEAVKEF